MDSSNLQTHILALERQAWDALCRPGGMLLPLLGKECVMIFPGGTILTHESIPSIRSTLTRDSYVPWKSYTITDESVVRLGDGIVLIYYDVEARRQPGPESNTKVPTFTAVCASTWAKDGENWKMISHQQTLT